MPEPLRAFFGRFVADRGGVASVIGALLMLLGLGLGVLVLDVGHLYLAKRRLQGAVDAAALAAAGDPANASAIVTRVLSEAGYSQSATVTTGAYNADSSVPVADRFDTDPSAQQNAVRVHETISTPGYLAGIFGGGLLSDVSAAATAAKTPVTSFAAGTGLASLSGGELNAVLGGLLGTSLSLSLVNYQALASTNVDALTFLDQLAIQAGVSAGTYGDLADTTVTAGQMAAAASTALNIHPDGNDAAALDALNLLSLQSPAGTAALVSQLVDTSVWQKRQIGSIVQQTPGQVSFNLFDLVSAMARAYGADHLADLGTTITIPITGSTIQARLVLGAPMASAAAATVGTSISTAQTRLALTATLANINLGVATATVTLPLYLEVASGTATVAAIPCRSGGTMVTISTASQAAAATIGLVSDSDLADFGASPTIQPATVANIVVNILGIGIPVAITATGSLPVAAGSGTNMNFTQSDIDAGTVKEAAGSDAGTIFSGLASSPGFTLSFSPSSGAIATILNGTVLPILKPLLVSILSDLDAPVDTLLRTLGLRLGVIDVVDHGVRCSAPTLVS
jgi:tight adherence protein G